MKLLRQIKNLLFPKKNIRSEEEQKSVEEEIKKYSLYQFPGCPYCIIVRRAFKRLNLPMEIRDASSGDYRAELKKQGGKLMAPCLRIDHGDKVQWMYESRDIIKFLEAKFGGQS